MQNIFTAYLLLTDNLNWKVRLKDVQPRIGMILSLTSAVPVHSVRICVMVSGGAD